jgi:hypothetical protein
VNAVASSFPATVRGTAIVETGSALPDEQVETGITVDVAMRAQVPVPGAWVVHA